MPWCHADYSLEEASSWIQTTLRECETGTMYDFAILSNGRFAGGCGVNHINAMDRVANLGYWIQLTPHTHSKPHGFLHAIYSTHLHRFAPRVLSNDL